jgi:DNA repair protein RecN (Recombination protein N)
MAWVESLRVRNLATFRDVIVPFRKGLNVITGESGSGKTLIVRAMGVLLGEEKDEAELIRTGASEITLEASVSLEEVPKELKETLKNLGLHDEPCLTLGKTIPHQGKTRAHVLGVGIAKRLLSGLGQGLIELIGQGNGGRFRDSRFQHQILDELLCVDSEREAYQKQRVRTLETLGAYRKVVETKALLERQWDTSEALLAEILRVSPRLGEEAELEKRQAFLKHAKEIQDALLMAKELLYDAKHSVLEGLGRARKAIEPVCGLLSEGSSWSERLLSDALDIEDVALAIGGRIKEDVRPEELDEVNLRLLEIRTLKKRFGKDLETLLEEADRVRGLEGEIEALGLEVNRACRLFENEKARLFEAASKLSQARQGAIPGLEGELSQITAGLGLEALRFIIRLDSWVGDAKEDSLDHYSPQGLERLSLEVAFNKGDALRPIERVASGGELSRVVLALYTLAIRKRRLPVLVLDEIDSGVSGAGARALGSLLRSLAKACQVILVTHNPLVASYADHHLVLRKRESEEGTFSEIFVVEEETRKKELERMLVGSNISKHAMLVAEELLSGNHITG